ncbi:hypothetical protein L204_105437 [Cryptococcus depauperatus]
MLRTTIPAHISLASYQTLRWLSQSCSRRTQKEPFQILFCGSDEFSVASLKAIHEAKDLWSSIHVVVPTEKDIGRGGRHHRKSYKKYIPALRLYAEAHNLTTSTIPSTGIKTWSPPLPFSSLSKELDPSHLLLTASFGHIIPNSLLNLFLPSRRLNVHPSLLPRWRGAAPVQWTIASGDKETGVSVQTLVRSGLGVDAGDIAGNIGGVEIPDDADYETLLSSLADEGGRLLVDVLRQIRDGTASFTPQDEQSITLAPKITLENTYIHWKKQSAPAIDCLHRGISHHHPLWTSYSDITTQILSLRPTLSSEIPPSLLLSSKAVPPGTALLYKSSKMRRLFVSCAERRRTQSFFNEAVNTSTERAKHQRVRSTAGVQQK